jgi:acyl-CoA thioester hydrolase
MSNAVAALSPAHSETLTIDDVQRMRRSLVASVEERFVDRYGHMNSQYYIHLFDQAGWQFFAGHGVSQLQLKLTNAGLFTLEARLNYVAELRRGAELHVHSRLLSMTDKVLRVQQVMVDVGRSRIAALFQGTVLHVDLRTRKGSPLPEFALASLRESLQGREQAAG